MSLDFQQVRQQVVAMGERAPQRAEYLRKRRQEALRLAMEWAEHPLALKAGVQTALEVNPHVRCALPLEEPLTARHAPSPLLDGVTLLAADGSQINPDRHAAVDYCLVNVGAIQMRYGFPEAPTTRVHSRLFFDDQMYIGTHRITDRLVALMRDLNERLLLAELAQQAEPPIITLTDGPLELWGGGGEVDSRVFDQRFQDYLGALESLRLRGAVAAGYIDKPRGDLLVRLLEIAALPEGEIEKVGRDYRPLLGVMDTDLFQEWLACGERSAVFGIQSRNASQYPASLALHFFYLNVGWDEEHPYLVRVEIPAWVAENATMLNDLHAALVHQCGILGRRPYPYILHRSHEVAVVTREEKRQLESMIALELQRRGVGLPQPSHKQAAKEASGE